MATPSAEEIVQLGYDITAMKYCTTAALALYMYDYLLTLSEEVQYIWRGRKTWIFYVFLINRYFPMIYVVWSRIYLDLEFTGKVCDKVSIFGAAFVVWNTLIAQILLTTRVYALTGMNRLAVICFASVTVVQFVMGLVVASTWNKSDKSKLSLNYFCTITLNIDLELVYFAMALFFDCAAFVVILSLAIRSTPRFPGLRMNLPYVIRTVVRDATLYFGVIFTSQLILMVFQASAKDGLKTIPAPVHIALLPILVSRLVLSLKESIDTRFIDDWWFAGPRTTIRDSTTFRLGAMEFAMDDFTVRNA